MAASDLATLADVRAYLRLTSTADDQILAALVTAASDWIVAYLSRPIRQATASEPFSGRGNRMLYLPRAPVTDVSAVTIDGQAVPARVGTGKGFSWAGQVVYLEGYAFTRGQANVLVTYTAGYAEDAIPASLKQACVELVAWRYRERERIGELSRSLPASGESISFSQAAMPANVDLLLAQWRNVVPC